VGTHFELVTRRTVGFKGISVDGHSYASRPNLDLRGYFALGGAITLPKEGGLASGSRVGFGYKIQRMSSLRR
jgi:hypothetical protein